MLIVNRYSANGDQRLYADGLTPQGTPMSSRGTPGAPKKGGKPHGGKGNEKPEPSHVDRLVQYELRTLLKVQLGHVGCDKSFGKRKAHALQLIYASLQYDENDANNMLISREFFEKHIKRPAATPGNQPAKDTKGTQGGMFGFVQKKEAEAAADDDEEAIKNSVLVCIIPTHLILLKEHWESWVFLKNSETLRDYKKQASKKLGEIQAALAEKGGGGSGREQKEGSNMGTGDAVQAAME